MLLRRSRPPPVDRSAAARLWPAAWSGPWWMHQLGDDSASANVDAVAWTLLGDLASPERLAVDPAGYLWIPGSTWGVDWWIGADDRWHVPARDAAVRQALVDGMPVIETAVRVPGGDVVQRVAVVPGPHGPEAAVEIVNASAAPVALAVAVRPATLLAAGRVDQVGLVGRTVTVEGLAVLVLPGRPRRALLTTASDPDALTTVMGGGVPEAADATIRCPAGMASAVAMVPIPHRTSWGFRVALTATVGAGGDPATPWRPTDMGAAARGWRAQVDRRTRLDLPADRVTAQIDSVRAHLLLAAGEALGHTAEAAEVAVAAATAGLTDPDAAAVVARAGRSAGHSPALPDAGAALWAAGRLVELGAPPPGGAGVAALVEAVARGARGATDPVHLAWAAAGLHAAGPLLEGAGERRAAAVARRWQRDVGPLVAAGSGDGSILAGVLRAGPAAAPPTEPLLAPDGGGALVDLARTLMWAAAVPGAGWHERVGAVMAVASPTSTWPDLLAPGRPGGGRGRGHSPLVTARLWAAVRAALLTDGDGIAFLPGWVEQWRGQALEVHGLAATPGPVSFAVRWHGDRPALLWAVEGATGDLRLTAPGLDPGWCGHGATGEALLASPPRPPRPEGPSVPGP